MNNHFIYKPLSQLLVAAAIASAPASRSAAVVQTSSEIWVGSGTTIQGNGGTGTKVSFFSQRMILPLETAGTVSSLQSAVLTDTNSNWADGQFGAKGLPSYVEFDNGWTADIADCSASNHCLTLAGSLGSAVTPGNSFRVHKHFTIAGIFGTNNEAGLKSGLNPSTADNILLQIPQSQQVITVFYYDDGSYHAWLDATYAPADSLLVYPEQGIMVRRRLATDLTFYQVGPVKVGPLVVTIDVGNNLVGTLKSITPLTLPALNLYTGDANTGLADGLNPTASDNLVVIHPDGSTATYFYYKDNNFQGWLDATYNLANNAQIDPGTAFFLRRKTPHSPFNWTIPSE